MNFHIRFGETRRQPSSTKHSALARLPLLAVATMAAAVAQNVLHLELVSDVM